MQNKDTTQANEKKITVDQQVLNPERELHATVETGPKIETQQINEEASKMDEKQKKLLLDIYKSAPFQVISKDDVETVKAARSLYADIGWGNWVAALGIAAGSITPLMAIGIPGWAIGAVLVIGTIFWRETNFEGVRGRISTQFASKNTEPGKQAEKVRDKKLHKFHALAVDALNDASNKDKSEDEQIDLLTRIINSEYKYHITKRANKSLHVVTDKEKLLASVITNIRTTLENSDRTTIDGLDINALLQEFRELLNSNTDKLDIDDFKIKVLKDRRQKQQRSLDHNSAHPNGIRNVKLISGQIAEIAASFGNGFGCFVAGLTTTGFVLGLFNVAFISPIVPLTMGSLMAYAGYCAYKSNTVPAITGICKSFYYDYLDVTRPTETPAETSGKPAWWRKPARSLLMVIGIISSICMGCAIGTFNYQFGIFLVAVYLNPALLTSTAALATLAGPTTLAGMIIGASSGVLVAIGTTCLFLRYITEGLTSCVSAENADENANENADEKVGTGKKVFDMVFSLSIVALVTLFSVYSVKYYVVSSLPAALQQLGSIAVWLTGSIVYVCQTHSVVSNFLVNYGDWFGGKDAKDLRNCVQGFAAHTFLGKTDLSKEAQAERQGDNEANDDQDGVENPLLVNPR
jgi:nitrate reductase gamma subunit